MRVSPFLLALISVTLTATAQLLLKSGVMHLLGSTAAASKTAQAISAMTSPLILSGLLCFAASVLTWLAVLSRLDVSQAYPFVSLGIVLTMLGGHYLLGEPLQNTRILGGVLIVAGVLITALR
jgi:drug/metabolite transporter (DMT)-like permease